jgi:hypothetical protein
VLWKSEGVMFVQGRAGDDESGGVASLKTGTGGVPTGPEVKRTKRYSPTSVGTACENEAAGTLIF